MSAEPPPPPSRASARPEDARPGAVRPDSAAGGRRRHSRQQDREIARLAIPALGALVAEPLFLLADSAIVGHLGVAQLAGLGIAGAALSTLVSVFVFLAYGTTAAVARRLGAGDLPGALAQGIDGMWLALILGVASGVAGIVLAPHVVSLFGGAATSAPYAETYLRIASIGIPAMLASLAATGVLRGLQDTRTPLIVFAGGAVVNVALNIALVYGLSMGIAGSALGTVLAQGGMAVWLGAVVVRGARQHHAAMRPDRHGILAAAHSGVPLVVRTLTLRAALLAMTYAATQQGDVPLAAHQIAFTIWSFLAFVLDAIAIAGQALTGRYLGASDVAGTRAVTRRMIGWGVAAGVVLGIAIIVTRPLYVGLFTPDPTVQSTLATVLVVAAVFQPVAGVVFVLDGVLIGAGDAPYLAWAGLVTLVVFLPLLWWAAAAGAGLTVLWWAFGGFMVARLVTLVARERTDAWLVTGITAGRSGR